MQLRPLTERLTHAAQRRRRERLTRRRLERPTLVAPEVTTTPPRMRFIDRLKAFGRGLISRERRANRTKAIALAMQVRDNLAKQRLRSAVSDRCPFMRKYTVVVNGRVEERIGDPCGGRLRPHRGRQLAGITSGLRQLQCHTCGRVYVDDRSASTAAV